ncbi:hypothetical protein P152DRAFT_476377 [Eremomyces bilateralis CBS 781.70]|uniref:VWFA domain-containing protein n=1 Tax=Eremomyces bilateralis CBS 781.70 TaxID=1392243 RepID=A0A6G1FUM9_9PEZI|nr:uncharacterized protein P152DRAFT_476377 [Eremomyces bilateralis CBS 781.70]KAF1809463.1 hypothetical protein P152DRAFT_476377 [Eremomyces bilateralis CBS 781.70]
MERRQSIFKNLKSKFGSKNSNSTSRQDSFEPASSPTSMADRNPLQNLSPVTRRPIRPGMNAFITPSNEPPPAYTPAANSQPNPAIGTSAAASDDTYAFLGSFDTVFLIDDSGSMAGRSWRETAQALETITPICTVHDADGIDLYFLNQADSPYYRHVQSVATVREIFSTVRPRGGTPTGQRLNQILRPYVARCAKNVDAVKPLNVIVITDGAPSDDVESVLISAAKKLDKMDAPAWQVGVQFFQVGREPGAKEHLKQLDDELAELAGEDDLRDMVDTVPFTGDNDAQLTGDGILKVVLGAVTRRLDRKRSKDLHRNKTTNSDLIFTPHRRKEK